LRRSTGVKTQSSFKIGRILGKCQLLQQIGQGGMGSVYVAKHLFLQRMVTVKLLKYGFNDVLERNIEAFEQGPLPSRASTIRTSRPSTTSMRRTGGPTWSWSSWTARTWRAS
jgi:serine/threonine protein kinase